MPDDGGGGGQGRSTDGVLSPDELDITDDESVVEIDDGRYVIGTGNGPPRAESEEEAAVTEDPTPEAETGDVDAEAVYAWLRADLDDATSQYGFDVTATFDDETDQHRLLSNDVVTTFEQLLRWYAGHLDEDTPVENVLGILLLESNITVRYPPEALTELLAAYDVSPDDSVRELLTAVRETGVRIE
ncbi:MAG: hypothetical protein ABEJ82_10260 [Haloplanus sp.]